MVISAMVDRKTTVKELMQRTAKLVAVQVLEQRSSERDRR